VIKNSPRRSVSRAQPPRHGGRGVDQTSSASQPALRDFVYGSFDQFQLAGLALICLKNETKTDAERDVRDLISMAGADVIKKERGKGYCTTSKSSEKAHPLELAKYSLEQAKRLITSTARRRKIDEQFSLLMLEGCVIRRMTYRTNVFVPPRGSPC